MQLHKLKKHESRTQDGEPVHLTPAGIRRLQDEVEKLRRRLPGLAAETERTAAYGDRSDNAEYKQAKGALRSAHRKIFGIESQLKRAVAIPSGPDAGGKVRLGSTVVLKTSDGGEKTFEIVGPAETDPPNGRISHRSPLGAALIGHATGDAVTVAAASGTREYLIIKII
ncbi:MAG TPA: GreA/GreB family elongation factor [Candidatus Paceibacterota bacterium]|nr:GreA/GreB family elongation factor [Candidatus Paceibacterota bacterium]